MNVGFAITGFALALYKSIIYIVDPTMKDLKVGTLPQFRYASTVATLSIASEWISTPWAINTILLHLSFVKRISLLMFFLSQFRFLCCGASSYLGHSAG